MKIMLPSVFPGQVKFSSRSLMSWYAKNKRDLPWRRTCDPYKIWVSEVMLQQTSVTAVIAYYQRWIKSFPTIYDLARAPLQKVLKQWQGLGYYNRAKNLHLAARIVAHEYKGILPKDPQIVRSLPGFGPYTTGAVLSIAYQVPLTIIDANIRRVVMRLLALPGLADSRQDLQINRFLSDIIPVKNPGDFNQALMELGAMLCRAKGPLCSVCPLSKYCQAYLTFKQDAIPKTKKKTIINIYAVIAIIQKNNRYLIRQRPSKGLLADLWEFPGDIIKEGQHTSKVLSRILKEELHVTLKRARHLFNVSQFYTQYRVHLKVYTCRYKGIPVTDSIYKWVDQNSILQYPMPSGSVKILHKLLSIKNP